MTEYGCKVCRVLDDRDMDRYEDRLVEQWVAEGSQRKGYRQLATWLNVTMLRREMDRVGLSTLGDEPRSKYDRLRSDDETVAPEVADSLHNAGIDVDRLRKDFVSYGVIRTHLKECLDVERESSTGDWEEESIEIARDRFESKVFEAVRSLQNKGEITAGGDIEPILDVEVECQDCHTRVPVERALRRGYICRDE